METFFIWGSRTESAESKTHTHAKKYHKSEQ